MSILDFLNPGNDVLSPAGSTDAQPTPQPQAAQPEPAISPAAIIQMAAAMKEQKTQDAKKEGRIPAMYDSEGRKLGPTGVLLALQRDLRLAQSAGDGTEIQRIEALLPDVEQAVEAFVKKSGLSRAQLFPDPTRTKPLEQQAALTEIARLRARCADLHAQAKRSGSVSVARFKRLLEARTLQGQAALVAHQAGLIDTSQLTEAGTSGVWTLIDLDPARGHAPVEQGADQARPDQQTDSESDRP